MRKACTAVAVEGEAAARELVDGELPLRVRAQLLLVERRRHVHRGVEGLALLLVAVGLGRRAPRSSSMGMPARSASARTASVKV